MTTDELRAHFDEAAKDYPPRAQDAPVGVPRQAKRAKGGRKCPSPARRLCEDKP